MSAAAVRIIAVPVGLPVGWDAADAAAEGWSPDQARAWLRANVRTVGEVANLDTPAPAQRELAPVEAPPPPVAEDAPHTADDAGPPPDDLPPPDEAPPADLEALEGAAAHFTCLGHDHGTYYYLARGAAQVLSLAGGSHSKGSLLMLAPLVYWEREFPGREGCNWLAAANALLRWSERAGVYEPERVRGRGAWWDDGRHVLHLGDRIVSGAVGHATTSHRTTDFASRYIYEAKAPLRFAATTAAPLRWNESRPFRELCRLFSWERPIQATLLAGWCVVAPICGALRWRPHIWITGPAGSGKSWVYQNLLRRSLGEISVAVASETTEAGLRQYLAADARPVIFDEAEGETARAQARIQNVLALMRQASSDTSARIIKGTATGTAQQFDVRSCFAFSSIGVGLQQHADLTRVTVLSLQPNLRQTPEERSRHFTERVIPAFELLTDSYVDRLHARTLAMIPIIRANAETFARAGAIALGTRRMGDQVGALLAGAYSLHADNEVSLEFAAEWIRGENWSEETQSETRDEVALLNLLLQHTVRVQLPTGSVDRSVGELVQAAKGLTDHDVKQDDAADTLRRMGLRVDLDVLYIANTHTGVRKILANTPWTTNWARVLKRLDGAQAMPTMRFAGVSDRCVGLPLDLVLGDPSSTPPPPPSSAAPEPGSAG